MCMIIENLLSSNNNFCIAFKTPLTNNICVEEQSQF